METKHTPTPWRKFYEGSHEYLICADADGKEITAGANEADADYILQAVNNHDRLTEALRLALAELLHLGAEEKDINGDSRESPACQAIRHALRDNDNGN